MWNSGIVSFMRENGIKYYDAAVGEKYPNPHRWGFKKHKQLMQIREILTTFTLLKLLFTVKDYYYAFFKV